MLESVIAFKRLQSKQNNIEKLYAKFFRKVFTINFGLFASILGKMFADIILFLCF